MYSCCSGSCFVKDASMCSPRAATAANTTVSSAKNDDDQRAVAEDQPLERPRMLPSRLHGWPDARTLGSPCRRQLAICGLDARPRPPRRNVLGRRRRQQRRESLAIVLLRERGTSRRRRLHQQHVPASPTMTTRRSAMRDAVVEHRRRCRSRCWRQVSPPSSERKRWPRRPNASSDSPSSGRTPKNEPSYGDGSSRQVLPRRRSDTDGPPRRRCRAASPTPTMRFRWKSSAERSSSASCAARLSSRRRLRFELRARPVTPPSLVAK